MKQGRQDSALLGDEDVPNLRFCMWDQILGNIQLVFVVRWDHMRWDGIYLPCGYLIRYAWSFSSSPFSVHLYRTLLPSPHPSQQSMHTFTVTESSCKLSGAGGGGVNRSILEQLLCGPVCEALHYSSFWFYTQIWMNTRMIHTDRKHTNVDRKENHELNGEQSSKSNIIYPPPKPST